MVPTLTAREHNRGAPTDVARRPPNKVRPRNQSMVSVLVHEHRTGCVTGVCVAFASRRTMSAYSGRNQPCAMSSFSRRSTFVGVLVLVAIELLQRRLGQRHLRAGQLAQAILRRASCPCRTRRRSRSARRPRRCGRRPSRCRARRAPGASRRWPGSDPRRWAARAAASCRSRSTRSGEFSAERGEGAGRESR